MKCSLAFDCWLGRCSVTMRYTTLWNKFSSAWGKGKSGDGEVNKFVSNVSLRWLLGQYLFQPNIFTLFYLRHPLWMGTIERKKFNKNISIKRAQTGMWSERGWIKHFQICTSPPTFKWVAVSGYVGEKMREWRKKSSTSAAMWPLTSTQCYFLCVRMKLFHFKELSLYLPICWIYCRLVLRTRTCFNCILAFYWCPSAV